MAKTDLLKEAIADAKAVKETAIANAKIALEEAFGSRLESMLGAKLSEQLDDEEAELEMAADEEDVATEPEMDLDEPEMDDPTAVRVGVDLDMDGSYDIEGELGGNNEMDMDEPDMDMDEPEMDMDDSEMDEPDMEMDDSEMDMELDAELDEIIKELEEGMYEEEDVEEQVRDSAGDDGDGMIEEDIDAIIESILSEEEVEMDDEMDDEMEEGSYKMKEELDEAYSVIKQLQYTINEVNLLNAKLLFTNKLFRNFELNESQKMKVIENFDRAASTREVKLVFSTLSESFKRPTKSKKRIVKEGYASKPVTSTAPKKEIISESVEFANRWKKLAGLI